MLAQGRRFGSRYVLERPIGRGGMAAVWLATDERLDRPVAVKVLSDTIAEDDEFLGRFRREARLAAGLQHPNLVRVYDFDAGARPYLVMEYVEGGTLAERISGGAGLDPESLARELLEALRHIHAAGILHRDVKPQNVLIDGEGHTRLTDFGIALTGDATSLTRTGHVIGTETYLAPELRRGEHATERSDLYALGIVLAECARDGTGASLWTLIDRLRDPVPSRRPSSAAAALAELDRGAVAVVGEPTRPLPILAADDGGPPTAEEPTITRPAAAAEPEAARRRPRVAVLAALGAVALAAGVALAIGLGGGDDPGGAGQQRASDGQDNGGSAPEDPAPEPAPATTADTPAPTEETVAEEPVAQEPPADGAALNQEGFELIGAGNPDEAIPVLEDAVAALEGSGDELTYNYALFNLAHALRVAGRPDEAIPLLEQRLEYPDQQEEVAAELEAAKAEAGEG